MGNGTRLVVRDNYAKGTQVRWEREWQWNDGDNDGRRDGNGVFELVGYRVSGMRGHRSGRDPFVEEEWQDERR